MCIATTTALTIAAVTSAVAALAGGVVSTAVGYSQSKEAEANARFMEEQEYENAKRLRKQAEAEEIQANNERQQLRTKMLQQAGKANTAYASSGIVLGSGSHADYMADIADAYDLDSKNLEYDIANRKWKLRAEAVNHENQGAWYGAQADSYAKNRPLSLLGGAISTAGNTAASFTTGYSAGAFSGGSSTEKPKLMLGGFSTPGIIGDF